MSKLGRGHKSCEKCGEVTGPRTKICQKCLTPFKFKSASIKLDRPAKAQAKPGQDFVGVNTPMMIVAPAGPTLKYELDESDICCSLIEWAERVKAQYDNYVSNNCLVYLLRKDGYGEEVLKEARGLFESVWPDYQLTAV